MRRKEELVRKVEDGESIDYSGVELDGSGLDEMNSKQGFPSLNLLTITKMKSKMPDTV